MGGLPQPQERWPPARPRPRPDSMSREGLPTRQGAPTWEQALAGVHQQQRCNSILLHLQEQKTHPHCSEMGYLSCTRQYLRHTPCLLLRGEASLAVPELHR